ncbi:uncharacterized DUF497 family protein [Aminobacter niigataensis]|uniref:Uncharacterized DUF497 family protein n=1 Tax=Aminobacter niigataensis TaxID=83265 RepID=A0ABR6KV49_9HYPH|nr:BrnT family toxin [Aminobacter niigataensis]MBB4648397.1 uncharacterized DUF497 family protein [Aminobacter niigataensis]
MAAQANAQGKDCEVHIRNRHDISVYTEILALRNVFVYTLIVWRGGHIKLEWDQAKAETNEAKHGVSFERARAFEFDTALIVEDDRADYGETRLVAIGLIGSRVHVIVYTERGDTCRVISLRKANRREIDIYVQSF